jgi:hypothetical protein
MKCLALWPTLLTRSERSFMRLPAWLLTLMLGATVVAPLFAEEQPPSAKPEFSRDQIDFFEKQVQPILVGKCLKCHGGEEKVRSEFRVTGRRAIIAGGELGPAIVLDKPEESSFLKAINYAELEMPPSGKLPAEEIAILTKWVKEGLPWTPGKEEEPPKHEKKAGIINDEARSWWAYQPIKRPTPPAVKNGKWIANPIDNFILAKIEAAGLTPAPPADPVALVRRLYYDLTGLPPTPADVDAFVKDPSPAAYENLIDKLLDSKQYGEHWGRHWLDLVRYAETNGYERDNAKPEAWRYRDYVIDALNQDKPYDRFLLEQLAGDELDEVTPDSLIATGYYRLGIWDDEPADRLLAKYDVLDGIVSTTSNVLLGMSAGCARCHDHKKDPFPQRDYYRLMAFFHGIADMNGKNLRKVSLPQEMAQYDRLVREKQERESKLQSQLRGLEQEFAAAWKAKGNAADAFALEGEPSDERVLVGDSRVKATTWKYSTVKPSGDWMQPDYPATEWKSGPGGFGTRGTPGAVVRTQWNTRDIWLQTRFTWDGKGSSPALDVHHDEDIQVYLNGVKIFEAPRYLVQYQRESLGVAAMKALKTGENVLAVHCKQTGGGQYVDVGLVLRGSRAALADLVRQHGSEIFGAEKARQYQELAEQLEASRKQSIPVPGMEVMAVQEAGMPETFVQLRGNPTAKGEKVQAGFPGVLSTDVNNVAEARPVTRLGMTSSGRRRALAEWLVSQDNPLTSRVMVNRLWQYHFGRGIVPSSNDFGKLGELPTHPELLDWLAADFRDHWSLKRMHKLMLLSSTYRLSSQANPQALAKDPGNTLFWRFSMRRLFAEEIRDSVLAVSGQLNLQAGGPSIYPPIPKAVLAGQSVPGAGWKQSPPEEAARRSVYVHVKRSLLVPILGDHDAADTDNSCPVRFATTVPTQSLGMLNGDFTNEQAALFAKRLEREAPDDEVAQVKLAIRLTTGRTPTAKEIADDRAFLKELRERPGMNPERALAQYCLVLLNANEFVYLD